nr:hypothetical protein [Tanacetum cinerariifolium]
PEDLVPAEDEAPASFLPPGFLSPRTPPLLHIPLSTPSTSRRVGIPEADTPPRNRPLLATPRPGCEVGESSAAAARRPGPTMAYEVDCSYKDRAAVRAGIESIRGTSYVLETHARRLEWQCQAVDDLAFQHIMRTQALEAGARDDTLEETASKRQIMARTRRGQTPPPTNPNNPNNMTPEAVQTMIDQALLRNSDGRDGSHSSHAENPRNMHTVRPCYYVNFMKCHPLNFKGTKGAVGLTRWIEKMESIFNISGYAVENQKKMTDKYCPLGEVKKLEIELWNLKVRDNNIPAFTNRFQKLALICTKFVSNETEKVDKSTGNTNATNNRSSNEPNPRGNGCFKCGNPGAFKRDCPKLNNKNEGNGNAQGWVYAVGNAERNGNAAGNPDSNVVMAP